MTAEAQTMLSDRHVLNSRERSARDKRMGTLREVLSRMKERGDSQDHVDAVEWMIAWVSDRGSNSALYGVWKEMRARCHSPNSSGYAGYGAKGITVCERWRGSFALFVSDMGPKPSPKHSIDRIDGTKGYDPTNCRWATSREQLLNRRVTRRFEYNGETKTIPEWSDITGISRETIRARIRLGWPMGDAVSIPPMNRGKGAARYAAKPRSRPCKA